VSDDARRPHETHEDAVARRVAEALTARIPDLDALAAQADSLPDGAVTLEIPDHPIQRCLDGRAAARIWEVRGRAEDLLRNRDPDVARLGQAPRDEAAAEAALHAVVLARALWMAVGIRAALRDETTRLAKILGRTAQPMRVHLPKDTPAPDLDGFEAILLPHPEGRRLVVTSRTVFAAWPFWALDDENAPKGDRTGPDGTNASDRKVYVLPPGPQRPGPSLLPPRR